MTQKCPQKIHTSYQVWTYQEKNLNKPEFLFVLVSNTYTTEKYYKQTWKEKKSSNRSVQT